MSIPIKTIKFRQDQLAFRDQGKGRVVVLLHGYLASSAIFEGLAANLAKRYRVVSIDLPGHGASACYGYAHSMEMMATAVKAVLDSLKLKKYVLIGHSMGGYTALAFAEMYPDALRGLCLLNSTAYADSDEKKSDRLRAIRVLKSDKKLYTRSTIENLFARKNLRYLKEEIKLAQGIARQTHQRGMIAALHGMRDRPSREMVLGMVHYPVMMVIGELDNVLAPQLLLEQAESIQDKTVLYLEHDGHYSFLESPRQVAKSLRSFLSKCYKLKVRRPSLPIELPDR